MASAKVGSPITSCQAVMGKYLDTLAEQGFVKKHRSGKGNYYINVTLVRLFLDASGDTWTRFMPANPNP